VRAAPQQEALVREQFIHGQHPLTTRKMEVTKSRRLGRSVTQPSVIESEIMPGCPPCPPLPTDKTIEEAILAVFAEDTNNVTASQLTRLLNTHVGDPDDRFSVREVRAAANRLTHQGKITSTDPPADWPVVRYTPRYLRIPNLT
jgi:hypothetical protein